jgi:hypothetical protein
MPHHGQDSRENGDRADDARSAPENQLGQPNGKTAEVIADRRRLFAEKMRRNHRPHPLRRLNNSLCLQKPEEILHVRSFTVFLQIKIRNLADRLALGKVIQHFNSFRRNGKEDACFGAADHNIIAFPLPGKRLYRNYGRTRIHPTILANEMPGPPSGRGPSEIGNCATQKVFQRLWYGAAPCTVTILPTKAKSGAYWERESITLLDRTLGAGANWIRRRRGPKRFDLADLELLHGVHLLSFMKPDDQTPAADRDGEDVAIKLRRESLPAREFPLGSL